MAGADVGTFVERLWQSAEHGQLSRRDRAPGRYLAYVPDELGSALPELGPEAREAAEDALAVLARADERISAQGGNLNHLLIRSESISSSWIEGNRITPKRLAVAELLRQGSRIALEVVANVRATEDAIAILSDRRQPITVVDIERLQHVIEPSLEPGLRREQNWVGGAGWSPLRADFVPPPESEVPRLVDDLARFLTSTEGNAVVRAAIAHAQFETIHPFVDGNGRTGRALIHTVLRRSDALRNILVPISTVFAGDTNAYISGLGAFRSKPQRLDDWIVGFSAAAVQAAENAIQLYGDIERLQQETMRTLIDFRTTRGISPAAPRKGAVVLRIVDDLASNPVLTVTTAAVRHEVSIAAVHKALTELADAGILGRSTDHKGKLVCWTADRHLALVALTERGNRVGAGDIENRRPRSGPPVPDAEHVGVLRRKNREQ